MPAFCSLGNSKRLNGCKIPDNLGSLDSLGLLGCTKQSSDDAVDLLRRAKNNLFVDPVGLLRRTKNNSSVDSVDLLRRTKQLVR